MNSPDRKIRFSQSSPCPVCGGYDQMPRGQGTRCYGFLSGDGKFAQCTREDLAGGLKEKGGGTYSHWLEGDCRCCRQHASSSRNREAVTHYEIKDAADKTVAVHERKDGPAGKEMWWAMPDGRKGLNGIPTASLPLYGTPRLAESPEGSRVIITEGEKAADALLRQGILAVGTVTGAKGTPSPAVLEILRASEVLLWADADDDGEAHMRRIAERLLGMGIASRVIRWKEAGKGDDAADFFARGGTAEQVEDLVKAAEVCSPVAPGWAEAPQNQPDAECSPGLVAHIVEEAGLGSLSKDMRPADFATSLLKLGTLLRGKGPLIQALAREEAIRKMKEVGVKAPAAMIDCALPRGGAEEGGRELQGRGLAVAAAEPWPEPVDGAEMLGELVKGFQSHLILPPGGPEALALWTVHTYALPCAEHSPRLAITSPTKQCGKTQVLRVLRTVVNNPIWASNISPAAVFRTIEMHQPALLIDEADTFIRVNSELRGILNAGHEPGGQVIRTVGDDHEPRRFNVFSPLAIGIIGKLPPTLEDRSIEIPMRRKLRGESVERIRDARLMGLLSDLRRKIRRWAADSAALLEGADPEMAPLGGDRAEDNWRSLLAIADAAGSDWPVRAREARQSLAQSRPDDAPEPKERLISDIREIFRSKACDRISSEDLVSALAKHEDSPWSEWKKGQPITQRQLAALLKPFGISPKGIRVGPDSTPRGYELAAFKDVFDRYPEADASATSATPLAGNDLGVTTACNGGDPVSDDGLRNLFGDNDVAPVADPMAYKPPGALHSAQVPLDRPRATKVIRTEPAASGAAAPDSSRCCDPKSDAPEGT